MKVLVCGSRTWRDGSLIRKRLYELIRETPDPEPVLIHGAASGADQIAERHGANLGYRIQPFYADWAGDGKRAGILRNLAMLDEEPDLVLAFHLNNSPGTKHTITEAQRRGIPVEVISLPVSVPSEEQG